jgi:transposase
VLTGIVFVLRSGIAWNLLPQEMGCGSGTACWRRLVAWQEADVWQRIHETLLAELRRRGEIDLTRALVDSSSIRAMLAGKKPVRTLRTGANSAASITSSSTLKASRSQSS